MPLPVSLTKERYVTVCQQLLVTAVVAVLGASAAGVVTLDIVAPPGDTSATTNGAHRSGHLGLRAQTRPKGPLWSVPGASLDLGPRAFVAGGVGKHRPAG